jgi:hypothetical protein
VTPHILTRKTRLRPRNFLINDANALLQQYRPISAAPTARRRVRYRRYSCRTDCVVGEAVDDPLRKWGVHRSSRDECRFLRRAGSNPGPCGRAASNDALQKKIDRILAGVDRSGDMRSRGVDRVVRKLS